MPTTSRGNAQGLSFRIGQIVRVVQAIDVEIYDVSRRIGNLGEVLRLGTSDGDSTFAETFRVGFCDGTEEMFWPEELGAP